MGTFARSWELTKASWGVLMADKELALFTVMSACCTVAAFILFIVPAAVARGLLDSVRDARGLDPSWLALLAGFYFVTSFITIFFNTALIGAALVRMRGGDPDLSTGFAIAQRNLPAIAAYALISATVGIILYAIEEKFDLVGQIVRGILGFAWSVVTFLAVPVMVAEGISPFAAIQRSGQLLRRTWGEQLIGTAGIGAAVGIFSLPALLLLVLAAASRDVALMLAAGAATVLWMAILAVVASALGQIFRAAVYLYAETGTVPAGFDDWMMREAFRQRGQ